MKARGGLAALSRGVPRNFVLMGGGMALGLGMHVLAARRLGVREYGSFTHAHNAAALLALVVTLGWPLASMRFIAEYVERREWGLLRGVLGRAHRVVIALSLGGSAVLLVVAHFLRHRPEDARYAVMTAALLPLMAAAQLRSRVLRGLMRVSASILSESVAVPALVIACLWSLGIDSAGSLVLGFACASLLARGVETLYLHRVAPAEAKSSPAEYDGRVWMRVAGMMAFGELGRAVIARSDVVMLGSLAGPEAVGIYSVARRLCIPVTFTLMAVNAIAGPVLGAAYHGGRRREFLAVLRRSALWSVGGAVVPFGVVMLVPTWLLSLFGQGFTDGSDVLRVVALGRFANAATGPVSMALVLTGRERVHSLVLLCAAGAAVAANAYVIPKWGAAGAAWTSVGVAAAVNGCLYVLARRAAPAG